MAGCEIHMFRKFHQTVSKNLLAPLNLSRGFLEILHLPGHIRSCMPIWSWKRCWRRGARVRWLYPQKHPQNRSWVNQLQFFYFFVLKLIDSVGFATPWLRCFSHQSSREHLCMGICTSFQLPNCKLNGFDVTIFFLNGSESGLRKFCEQEAVSSGNFAVWELRSLSWRGLYFMSWDFLFRSRR